IPELRELVEKHRGSDDPVKARGAEKLEQAVNDLLARPEHAWYTGNLDPAEVERRKKAQEAFKKRY
ncbi:MAG: hydroxylamine oxidoreductase, partial [Candidatus Neomarinimicrobiota bacterium]